MKRISYGLIGTGLALVMTVATVHAAEQTNAAPETKGMTPAQMVALPDGGAPPPPDGYEAVEDNETAVASFSSTVRAHRQLGMPGGDAHQSTAEPNDAPSHFSLAGIPVKFIAPVAPPYTQSVYRTIAGSPGGQTDVMMESVSGQP